MKENKKRGAPKGHPVLKNPIAITVIITLSLLIVFGAAAGIVTAVRNARSLVSYEGVRIEKSAAAYLATTYKSAFVARHAAVDDPVFWEAEYEKGVSWGDLLEAETAQYIREVAAAAYLFDRYSSLTADERKSIKASAEDIVYNYYGSLDKKAFNRDAAQMGFDYDGLVDGLTLIYKFEEAKSRIYGRGGQVLSGVGYGAECEKYYSTFVYARLLFIRTDYEYVTDENGKFEVDKDGNLVTRPLTDEEKEQRAADAEEIRAAISALESGESGQMSTEFFNSMLKKYSFDEYTETGYFFSTVADSNGVPYADATKVFAEGGGDVILNRLTDMEVNTYSELDTDFGTCFVYRGELGNGLYGSSTYEYFFSDFYADAANYLYLNTLVELSKSVTVKEKYFTEVDIVALPYNSSFKLRGGFIAP